MQTLGYRPGLQQPGHAVSLGFACPPKADLAHIDQWLREHLLAVPETEMQVCLAGAGGLPLPTAAHQILWRAMVLLRSLARVARVPLFEAGVIVQLVRHPAQPNQWIASTVLPGVDGLDPGQLKRMLAFCLDVLLGVAATVRSPGNISKLQAWIELRFMTPLKKQQFTAGSSTVDVLEVARGLDIPFRHVGAGAYQLGWGCRGTLLDRSAVVQDSAIGARLSTNKFVSAQRMRSAGLPAPVHALVSDLDEATTAALQLGWPVVVKPADRDRGEGVTIGIRDASGLALAFEQARTLSPRVLVERQVPGDCYRIVVAHGTLLYAVKRLPKSVRGDGQQTVSELVEQANQKELRKPPWARLKPFPMDPLALQSLQAAGLEPGHIPEAGQLVPLRPMESTAWGGEIENATGTIHPDNVTAALQAAELLGLQVAGVDMISPCIDQPWHQNGAILNEVNFAPHIAGNTRSAKMVAFVRGMVDGDGRIPVWAVLGEGPLMAHGRALQAQLNAQGRRCYLTSQQQTETPMGTPVHLSGTGLFARSLALTLLKDVQAIVMVVDCNEFLQTGLPVDRIQRIFVAGAKDDGKPPGENASRETRALLQMLQKFSAPAPVTYL